MGVDRITRKLGLLAASSVMALALAAVPAAPGLDAGFLDLKSAQAAGNGGSANGGGNGNSGNAGSQGHGGGSAGASANGQGNVTIQGNHEFDAQSHGLTAASLEGLNAGHASIQGFAHASDESMVGQIRIAVQNAYENEEEVEEDGLISTIDPDEVLRDALAENLDVYEDIADALKGLIDDKVEVPET